MGGQLSCRQSDRWGSGREAQHGDLLFEVRRETGFTDTSLPSLKYRAPTLVQQ